MALIEPTQHYADAEHPSAEQLSAFVLGRLDEQSSAEVEQHVAECPVCGKWLETSPDDSFVSLFQDAFSSNTAVGDTAPVTPSAPIRFVQGYQLLEVLGEGGMGVIWKARREGLDRFVALKRIRSTGQPSPEALARFRREAEAVSHLRHANIVQIYDVGDQDGEPYLALEYVEGGNLARKLSAGPLPPRQAAALVETLAGAIHHAHQRGIIHRDLKPANILLASGGCEPPVHTTTGGLRPPLAECIPKISDFGLAKQLDDATAHTQTGAILGTPSYMAPEQAASEKPTIGPTADVYALGAILYETLTGRPPFRGPTVLDTLAQVRERDPVPPRQLQPSVPRDLETVCLQCLQKEPRKRYASGADLAADLRRFLDGQPIRARRAGFLERLVKWMRRNPAWAALGVVSVLALAALIGGGIWYQTRLRAAVHRADDNYRFARQAINQMLERLAKFQAPGVPQVRTLQRELSKDALTFFQGIAEAETDADPATRFDIALAYFYLGSLLLHQGQPGTALENEDHARLLLERLCAEEPSNRAYRAALAGCLEELAKCEYGRGRAQECLHFREQVLEVCRELCRREPDNADCQRALSTAHQNMGCCYETTSWDKAEFHWKEAIRILEKLVREHPELLDDQYRLAANSSNLALVYSRTGRIAEAHALYREVEPRLAKLVEENTGHKNWSSWACGLVKTLWVWGGMLVEARRGEEAGPLLNRAVAMMDKWCLEDPESPGLQALLLGCLTARMCNNTLLHRCDEGKKDWQRAVALSAKLSSWGDLCLGAVADARLGDHALAAQRAEYLSKQKDLTNDDINQLAKAYALASAAARKDTQLTPSEQERKADRYADRAITLLGKLRSNGYFDAADHVKTLQTDTDLDSLRKRDDFAQLVTAPHK